MIASAAGAAGRSAGATPSGARRHCNRYPQHRYGILDGTYGPAPPLVPFRRPPPAPAIAADAARRAAGGRLRQVTTRRKPAFLLGITVVFRHARWVAAAAARHAGSSPGPRLAPAGRAARGTRPQWRRLAEAALELGLGPEQLGETGLDPLAAARGWKPATVALYSKVARYGGIALPRVPTPEPDPPELDLRPLTQVRSEDPEHLRAVAWCALALAWPAPVGRVPVAAPRPGARHRPAAAGRHRRRRVGGARCADRLARLGDRPRPLPGTRGQSLGAAGAAPRPGPGLARSAAGCPTRRCR